MFKYTYNGREFTDRWDYQIYLAQEQLKSDCARCNSAPNLLQAKWRGGNFIVDAQGAWQGDWSGGLPPYDYMEIETAILDALVTQGSIPAWRGDGLSCAAQIADFIYRKQQEKIDALQKELDELKARFV